MSDFLIQYAAMTLGAGVVDLGPRTFVELAGKDRQKFLNNFCTADLRQLGPGDGAESFLLNVKGKILGHVLITLSEQSLLLDTVPGQTSKLLPHLDRYTLMDDVTLHDRSETLGELLLSGAQADGVILNVCGKLPPTKFGEHFACEIAGVAVQVVRTDYAGANSIFLRADAAALPNLLTALEGTGATPCSAEVAEVCRIEAGFPLFGRDIAEENLPQEVNRNVQAISFTKGCYLGQETVARIDALGHVNRLLVGVKFAGEALPTAGEELTADGKTVGHVTSAIFSPKLGAPLALAYVRTGHEKIGTHLTSTIGGAEVVPLPVA